MCMTETKLSISQSDRTVAGSGWLTFGSIMMKREIIPIDDVYVPIKRRATLEQKRVDESRGQYSR